MISNKNFWRNTTSRCWHNWVLNAGWGRKCCYGPLVFREFISHSICNKALVQFFLSWVAATNSNSNFTFANTLTAFFSRNSTWKWMHIELGMTPPEQILTHYDCAVGAGTMKGRWIFWGVLLLSRSVVGCCYKQSVQNRNFLPFPMVILIWLLGITFIFSVKLCIRQRDDEIQDYFPALQI